MRLSLQTDYALRTLIYLVAHPGRSTAAEVARFYLNNVRLSDLASSGEQLVTLTA